MVDLAGVTFCGARGLTLLADTAAAGDTINYALSGCPAHLQRHWRLLFADQTPIRRYASVAAAVSAIRADQPAHSTNWPT